MVVNYNGKVVYGSWNDGSDIYKGKQGYYIIQWNPKTQMTYKKYLPKSWKPKRITKATKTRKNVKRTTSTKKPKTYKK